MAFRSSEGRHPADRDERAAALKGRFARVCRSSGFGRRRHKVISFGFIRALLITLLLAAIAGAMTWDVVASPWPAFVTVRHWFAAPNCDAARMVGLAPARRGQPGYYERHDADEDGVSCEVWPPRSR